MLAGFSVALLLASCTLYASLHLNPVRAGWLSWVDALLAWSGGRVPNIGRRLIGSALIGLTISFGAPTLGICAWRERAGRRALYGDARFANDADIRKAGL